MTKNKAGGWIAGTAFLSILILVAAWFLLVSPTLATAAETRTSADSQLEQNGVQKIKLVKLKEQFENIDALRAELAALQVQVPSTADVATYKRQVDAVALAHTVTVVSFQTAPAVAIAAPVVEAPVAETPPAEGAPADSEAVAPAPAPPAPETFVVPVVLDVIGSYDNVLAFLNDLQTATPRLLLVEQIAGSAQTPAEAGGGKPQINEGDLEVVVNGSLYVLPPTPTAAPVPDPAAEPAPPAPLPPSNGRNPLLPLP
jgi:Tfp pilus assembly protein PilO